MNARVEAVRRLLAKALESLQEMTPFAVEYRYEHLDDYEDAPLDRDAAFSLVHELEVWAREHIGPIQ